MKVSEAIAILQEAPQDAELMLSSDEEGNSYRVANLSVNETFLNDGGWIENIHPDDLESGEYEGLKDKMFTAVVVW